MIAIITGDIINSRLAVSPRSYLSVLKKELAHMGSLGKDWEIFRGDSFQLKVTDPAEALNKAILLKAAVKSLPDLDVKLAIGIGEISFDSDNISESSGSAFLRSGELLKRMDEEGLSLGVSSPRFETDRILNLMLKLALTFMDRWTERMAETVFHSLKNVGMTQQQLGEILNIKQNTVSELRGRAFYSELIELISYYKEIITDALIN